VKNSKAEQQIEAIKKFSRDASKRQAGNQKITSRQELKDFLLKEVRIQAEKEVDKAIQRELKNRLEEIAEDAINEYCKNETDESKKNQLCK
jgi:hypothetical protein